MKTFSRSILVLILAIVLISVPMGGGWAWAQQKHFGRTCLGVSPSTCAAGYGIADITGAVDGDTAHVPADAYYGGPLFYVYDEDSGADEAPPDVVDDNSTGGAQRWVLQVSPIQAGGTGSDLPATARQNLDLEYDVDVPRTKLVSNLDKFNKIIYDSYYDCNAACESSGVVSLTGKGSHILFDEDATSDHDIDQFTGLVAGGTYKFLFLDEYWTVKFSGSYLLGHNGIDWEPTAGDSMDCEAIDTTYVYCKVSRPTALDISMYYDMPIDSTPDADDRWHGFTAEFLAGEALAQWDLVFVTHDSGTPECHKWHADLNDDCTSSDYPYDCCTGSDAGTCDTVKPIGVVIETGGITDTSTGTVGIGVGIGRNEGWALTNSEHEGYTIYGSTTEGLYSTTAPSTTDEIVCAIGIVLDENEIMFNFGLCANVKVGS